MLRQIRQVNPDLFADMPLNKAAALLTEVFRYVNRNLSAMDQGMENVPGFGKFRVRKLNTRQGSGPDQKDHRQIIFQKAAFEATAGSQKMRSGSSAPHEAKINFKFKK